MHVLADFDDFKQLVNSQDNMKSWCPALTSRTRVYPSRAWLASTTKHNLGRALRMTLGQDPERQRRLERTLAPAVLQTAEELDLFGYHTDHFLNSDDLKEQA